MDDDRGAYHKDFHYSSTIRSSNCSLLSYVERCKSCQVYTRTLNNKKIRLEEKVPTPEKNWIALRKGNNTLTDSEKLTKLKQLTSLSTDLKSKIKALEKKLQQVIKADGVSLQDSDSHDLTTLMKSQTEEIERQFPDQSSYQRLFWEQQIKYNRLKDKRGMRWHPMMIKWCLYLKIKSSSTYDALRNSGFIHLHSERLLYDYSHVINPGVGYNPAVLMALKTEIQQKNMNEDCQKYIGILHDEIRIKEDLVYDKHTGELVGFINLDQIGNSICNIEQSLKDETPKLAKNVLVIMVRGIASSLKFPFAHFATSGITSDQLFPILWKAVEILEVDIGLKVLFITSDGASPNRRFIRLHAADDQHGIVYRALNRYSDDDRYIYFISDSPHLIQTARNCMANSYSHKQSRRLWKDGKDISWLHIVNLFKDHCTGGLCLCPKLTRNHIDISSFDCMKVSLAVQVLSSTVANALELVYGPETSETVCFIRHMNKFFDCLNTRSLHEARNTRSENVAPYTSQNDPRLEYLLNDFLGYFNTWKSERANMQLSYQTLQGFEITIKSVMECVKLMLQKGAPYVLTEHFNQDPIEQYFGIVRTSGGCNNNPTLQQFNHAMVKVRVAGSQALAPFRGNIRRNIQRDFNMESQPLRKKKRPSV